MSDGFAYIDILIFAMVAAFIALRLRSVLGRRTGQERRRSGEWRTPATNGAGDNVVTLPERSKARAEGDRAIADLSDDQVKSGLTQIRIADQNFDFKGFLAGAQAAFKYIVEAYAAGEREALRSLLDDDVFSGFARAIDQREAAGQSLETRLLAPPKADVVEAGMVGGRARVTVRFTSEQVNVVRDAQGRVLEGDPSQAEEVIDVWTFERDTRSDDPNWLLVETRAPE